MSTINKDNVTAPLSHMVEVPRTQLATNFHFLPSTQVVTTSKTSEDAGPSYLPINTSGIIDATVRSNGYITTEVLNASTVFTTTATHQFGPLNMVTTNVPNMNQQHVRVAIASNAMADVSIPQTQMSIPISDVENISQLDADYKYLEGKQLATTGTMEVRLNFTPPILWFLTFVIFWEIKLGYESYDTIL